MERLPSHLTSFIGRTSAIELVREGLTEHRLVTLVGPGGCGKTRLAIEVARRAAGPGIDALAFVDFSGLADPALVAGAVTRAVGIKEVPGQDPLETLAAQLSKREVLLLLDNCEHLLDASADLAGALARLCPRVRFLATSRERLGVPGEAVVVVGGLELPERGQKRKDGWAERSEAGRLFVDRARMARADFFVDDPIALAAICERLDGIPLALELAAARAAVMSVSAIQEALSDCFRLLVGNERGGIARQKTLQASMEWSCGLLAPKERCLLHRLSVFSSGFTLEAARAVCAGGAVEPTDILDLVTSLVNKSLVQANPAQDRFRLHETMRAYAGGALEAGAETGALRDRHLGYFSALAKIIEPKTWTRELMGALASLSPDLDNLRSALDWGVESGQFEAAAALLSSLGNFFDLIGTYSEGLDRCQQLLAVSLGPLYRAEALYWASAYTRASDPAASMSFASELIQVGRLLGSDKILARGLCRAAFIQAFAQPDEGQKIAAEAVRLAQATGQYNMLVKSLQFESWACSWLGHPEEAFALAEKAVNIAQESDLLWDEGWARQALFQAAIRTGRLERSLAEARAGLRLSAELPGLFAYFGELHSGVAYMFMGDARASGALARARRQTEDLGHEVHSAEVQCCQGQLLVSLGQYDEGYDVLEAGTTRLEAVGWSRLILENRAVLAELALRRGDLELSRFHLELASSHVTDRGLPDAIPILRAEARLARAEGELRRSNALACDGLAAAFASGLLIWAIELLELVAVTVADLGHFAEGARLLGAADHQRQLTKYARSALARDEVTRVLINVEQVGEKKLFDQARHEGRGQSLEQAVGYALRGRGRRGRAVVGWESLTPSERRVACLVGDHLSNAEIAERLFVSPSTVKSHLNRVFVKLGVHGRGQLATFVHRRGDQHTD